MNRWIAVSAALALAGCAADKDEGRQAAAGIPPPAQEPMVPPGIDLKASALLEAYRANEVLADQAFKGARLRVTGTVNGIQSSVGDRPVVTLGDDGFAVVLAYGVPVDAAAALRRGQPAVLQCVGGGEVMGSPVLSDCTIEQSKMNEDERS